MGGGSVGSSVAGDDDELSCPICMDVTDDAFAAACGYRLMPVDPQDTKEHIKATDNKQHARSLEPENECFQKLKNFDVSTTATDRPSSLVGGSCCHCGQRILLRSHETPRQRAQQEKLEELSDDGHMMDLLQKIDCLRLGPQDTSQTGSHTAMEGPVLRKEETGYDSMKREGCPSGFKDFKSMLSSFMEYSQLKVIAELNNGVRVDSRKVVSSIELNKDEELFATAGISKTVEVFHFSSVVNGTAAGHGPVAKISKESKLSCLSWNKYMNNQFAVSDYGGIVAVHDAATSQSMIQFKEHDNRVWSIDFSHTEPHLLISGGDGCKGEIHFSRFRPETEDFLSLCLCGSKVIQMLGLHISYLGRLYEFDKSRLRSIMSMEQVKVWSTKQEASVLTINMRASICTVKYDPGSSVYLAVGSADHNIYYYDLRYVSEPVHKLKGHGKSVSHVEFSSSNNLVSASIDSSLRLWDIKKCAPVRVFRGHSNTKNFVGLSSSGDFIGCGSETNEVVVYHKDFSRPAAWHSFDSPCAGLAGKTADVCFVSAVCWKRDSSVMLAANGQGIIKVLALPFQQM